MPCRPHALAAPGLALKAAKRALEAPPIQDGGAVKPVGALPPHPSRQA